MNLNDQNVTILRIPIFARGMDAAIELVINTCLTKTKENRTISATGAHGTVMAQEDASFREILQNFTINLPDGKPLEWVGRIKQYAKMRQCTGPHFFENLMKASASHPIKHFLCGGREGVAENLAEVCKSDFGNPNICGTFCPPFLKVEEYDYEHIANLINQSGADVVWIGLSTPKQEQFTNYLMKHTNVHFIATVGAAFDFHTGNIQKAPKMVSSLGIEWFYRLCQEPKRLWKRYATIVPLFIYYHLKEFTIYSIKKN